jgi:hypothetical protein
MKQGVFAMMDCLGFKELSTDKYYHKLLAKLRHLRNLQSIISNDIYPKSIPPDYTNDTNFTIKLTVISDTIAVSMSSRKRKYPTKDGQIATKGYQLVTMAKAVQRIMDEFITYYPALLLRGCITYGYHLTTGNFILGDAVTQADKYMNKANGAFIWFLPPVSDLFDEWVDEYMSIRLPSHCCDAVREATHLIIDSIAPKYPVPMKDGHYLTTRVMNPYFQKPLGEIEKIEELYTNSFSRGDSLDVWTKREHTLKFLEHCRNISIEIDKHDRNWRSRRPPTTP